MNRRRFYLRAGVLLVLIAAMCSVFFHSLWELQVVHGPEYRARSAMAGSTVVPLPAARGRIVDRNGTVLVSDRLCTDIVVDEDAVTEEALRTLTELCRVRGVAYTESGRIFARDVNTDLVAALRELELPGVSLTGETVRQYHTACAAHLLGRVGPMDSGEWPEYRARGYAFSERVGKDGA